MKYLPGLLLLLLAACSSTDKTKPRSQAGQIAATATPGGLEAYRRYVDTLRLTDAASASRAAERYRSLFAGERLPVRDSAFLLFEGLYRRLDSALNKDFEKVSVEYDSLFLLDEHGRIPPGFEKAA